MSLKERIAKRSAFKKANAADKGTRVPESDKVERDNDLKRRIAKLPELKDEKLIALANGKRGAFINGFIANHWTLKPIEYNDLLHEARLEVEKRIELYEKDVNKKQQAAYLKNNYKVSSGQEALSDKGAVKYRAGKGLAIGSTVLAGLVIVGACVGIFTGISKNIAIAEKDQTINNMQQENDKTQGELDNTKEQLGDVEGNLAQQNIDAAKDAVNQRFYDAFGLTYDGLNPSATSTYNTIENEAQKFTDQAKTRGTNSEYAQKAQEHLDNIVGLLGGEEAASVRDDMLNEITADNYATIQGEASELSENVLIERYLYLANLAASKGCQLQSTMAELRGTYGEAVNAYEIAGEIEQNIQEALDYVDLFNDATEPELGDLSILTQIDGSNPAWLVERASNDLLTLENSLLSAKNDNLQDQLDNQNIPDPSVDDWQDVWFKNKGSEKSGLEAAVRGNNLVDITGVVKSDDDLVQGLDSYDDVTRRLTVVLKTKDNDLYYRVVLDLSKAENKEYTGSELADLIRSADSPVEVLDSTVYRAVAQNGHVFLVAANTNLVTDPDTGKVSTDVQGKIYLDSFGGASKNYNFNTEGDHQADVVDALINDFANNVLGGPEA